jgi:hypothetical protein
MMIDVSASLHRPLDPQYVHAWQTRKLDETLAIVGLGNPNQCSRVAHVGASNTVWFPPSYDGP